MPIFQTLFRSRKSENPRPRLPWPRIRRSQSAAVVLEGYLHHSPGDEEILRAAQLTGEPEVEHQDRQVSGQTVQSQASTHSNVTVCRRPSQRISLHLQELSEDWSVDTSNAFEEVAREGIHIPEVSDPFSDGKIASSSRLDHLSSSRYSEDPLPVISESGRRSYEDSSHQASGGSYGEYSQRYARRHDLPHSVSVQEKISSLSSQSNCITGLGLLDPVKAREAFNVVTGYYNLPLGIVADELETADVAQEEPTLEVGGSSLRHRFSGLLRPVKSTLNLGKTPFVASPARVPRLRRTKTFADLLRHPEPMTSLQGMSAEKLARLGGASFITLPFDLAPAPLHLPACIVASIIFLRKYGDQARAGDLFVDPGDLKEAIRLYDSFASQVLSAAKDEPRISSALRVITMPICQEGETTPVLTVAWTFKALLAGLPKGILGSNKLYETLKRIYLLEDVVGTDIPRAIRTRLISLAIVALTSEMQRSVICAVVGLLRDLLRTRSIESDTTGKPLRVVAITGLTRVFGPLLSGTGTAATAGPWRDYKELQAQGSAQVLQKIEEELVTGLLLEYWSDVNSQLRAWTRSSSADYIRG